jgi:hypothetical protein
MQVESFDTLEHLIYSPKFFVHLGIPSTLFIVSFIVFTKKLVAGEGSLVSYHHHGRISHATRELVGRSEATNNARTPRVEAPSLPEAPRG